MLSSLIAISVLVGSAYSCAPQAHLRYNANQPARYNPPPASLSSEVCCPPTVSYPLAEPRYFFRDTGKLFQSLKKYTDEKTGLITFYDSSCGLPLFNVPVGRTLEEFKNETTEHGWPSFRPQEIINGNVYYNKTTNFAYSKCGTTLGTTDTDHIGLRYCLDLVCVAGNPKTTKVKLLEESSGTDIVTFDSTDKGTYFKWTDLNDPVMGGRSTSTFTIQNNLGVFNGTTRIVPSLKAPGFCNAKTSGFFLKFNDISSYNHIRIVARTTTPNFGGFKITICSDTFDCQFDSFKANFKMSSSTTDFQTVLIPLEDFSNDWSSFTGECDTKDPTGKQHYCCSKNTLGKKPVKDEVCLSQDLLKKHPVKSVGLWTEGSAGDFHLEVKSIGAVNA